MGKHEVYLGDSLTQRRSMIALDFRHGTSDVFRQDTSGMSAQEQIDAAMEATEMVYRKGVMRELRQVLWQYSLHYEHLLFRKKSNASCPSQKWQLR